MTSHYEIAQTQAGRWRLYEVERAETSRQFAIHYRRSVVRDPASGHALTFATEDDTLMHQMGLEYGFPPTAARGEG